MKQLLNMFGGIAGLAIAGLVGLALFTIVGGLLIVGGVVIMALLVGGGIYALVTGRGPASMQWGRKSGVTVFDLRTGQPYKDGPVESEMIDITPPKSSKGPGADRA